MMNILNTEFSKYPIDLEALHATLQDIPNIFKRIKQIAEALTAKTVSVDSSQQSITRFRDPIAQSLNARKLYENLIFQINNHLPEFSLTYFKSLVEVQGFNLDLQSRINELSQQFPQNAQLQKTKEFLEKFRTKVTEITKSFEDYFTLLIPHLPNVTPDFIWANTKDENGQNGVRKFPEGFAAPAYSFREGGRVSNIGDEANKALKRFFAPKVIVENEKGNVVEILSNSPLELILELLQEKGGMQKLEQAFLKCQIPQILQMQEFIEKDFQHLSIKKELKEIFLTAFE